jgi:hypothetical protein
MEREVLMVFTDREIIKSYLLRGQDLYFSKSDGRIEIPRALISWEDIAYVFIYKTHDALLIYPNERGTIDLIGKTIMSAGRIRIPLSFLNKAGLNGHVFSITKEDNHLLIRPYNPQRSEDLNKFLDTLSSTQTRMLSNFISGSSVDADMESSVQAEPVPIFLSDKNMIFRTIGLPFRFYGFYARELGGEILLYKTGFTFYAIPGIKRIDGENTIGYLITNTTIYGNILAALEDSKVKKSNTTIELLFICNGCYDIKTYINPLSNVFNKDIEIAKKLCSNSSDFINENFRELTTVMSVLPLEPPILTEKNVRLWKNNSNH